MTGCWTVCKACGCAKMRHTREFRCHVCSSRLADSPLAQADPVVHATDASGNTPLLLAARSGDLRSVELLHACGAQAAHSPLDNGMTPLMMACMHGHCGIVRWALAHERASVFETPRDARAQLDHGHTLTPLSAACSCGHTLVALELLRHPSMAGALRKASLASFERALVLGRMTLPSARAVLDEVGAGDAHRIVSRAVAAMHERYTTGGLEIAVSQAPSAVPQSALQLQHACVRRWAERAAATPPQARLLLAARQRLALARVLSAAVRPATCALTPTAPQLILHVFVPVCTSIPCLCRRISLRAATCTAVPRLWLAVVDF